MRKGVAIAREISPLSRARVVLWLFLALLLTLAALLQLGHTITASTLGSVEGYTLISADYQSDDDCHGGAVMGSHCCSMSGCMVAIASALADALPRGAEMVQAIMRDAALRGGMSSPFFHPPKLIVQA